MHTRITLSLGLLLLTSLGVQAAGDKEAPRAERDGDRERPRHERERGDAAHAERDGDRERPRHERERGDAAHAERDGDRERPQREGDGNAALHNALRGRRGAEAIWGLLREQFAPELGELEHLGQNRPDQAPGFARHLVDQAASLLEMREHQPERFARIMAARKLDQETHELAARYRRAEGKAEREKLAKKLAAALEQAFAARLAMQEEEVAELATELKKRQQALAERRQNRARIITQRLHQLTGQAEELEW